MSTRSTPPPSPPQWDKTLHSSHKPLSPRPPIPPSQPTPHFLLPHFLSPPLRAELHQPQALQEPCQLYLLIPPLLLRLSQVSHLLQEHPLSPLDRRLPSEMPAIILLMLRMQLTLIIHRSNLAKILKKNGQSKTREHALGMRVTN